MPSPIRVPIHQKLNSFPTASAEEDANDAITAYLTRLLTKHERNQPLVYEDLLESYEVAKAVTAGTPKAQQEVEHLHESQLQAYEAYARTELAKLAESQEYPDIEEGESIPAYIERCVHTVKDVKGTYHGWRVSNEFMDEVFWSKVKSGARKAYFSWKSQSIKKDKQGKTADQKTDKVKAFEAAALGALVSKSGSQDSEMADGEDEQEEERDANENGVDKDGDDEVEDDEVEDDDGDDDIEEDEADAEVEGDDADDNEEADDDVAQDGGLCGAAEAGANGNDAPAAKTPMKTKKRRRLPNVPLGGGGNGSTADGGKKQPAKKQKTGKGANADTTGAGAGAGAGRGGVGGRGKGGAKNGKADRGGGGGRGTRKRNRKKGAGAGAGGVA